MPADVNKSINISVKADMKNALDNIKSLPNVTAKEAAEMRKKLKKEFKEAEKAAKKAELAQKKAMQTTAREAKKAAIATQKVTKETRNLRSQSRDLGAALGSLEDVVGVMSPELAGAAMAVGTLGQGFRTLSRSMATGSPIILGVIGTIAALATIYTVVTAAQQKAEEMQKSYTEGMKELNKTLEAQRKEASGVVGDLIDQQRQYDVLTGQISKHKADLLDLEDARLEAIKTRTKGQDEVVARARADINIAKKALVSVNSLTEAEEKRLQILMAMSTDPKISKGLGSVGEQAGQLIPLQDELNTKLQKQIEFRRKLESNINKAFKIRKEILEAEKEFREESEREEAKEKARAEAEKARNAKKAEDQKKQLQLEREAAKQKAEQDKKELERLRQIQKIQTTQFKAEQAAEQIQLQNKKTRISFLDDEFERFDAMTKLQSEGFDKRVSELEQEQVQNFLLAESIGAVEEAQKANAEIEEQIEAIREEQHLNEIVRSNERKKMIDEETQKKIKEGFAIAGYYSQSAIAASELIQTVSGENREAALTAFRISQAAALADIAMTTATKIMEVAPNPFAIGGIAALGALQAANVLAQSPPEKHMGGFISKGEDTRNVTVLTGEAVLDRRTVQRLGGEAGVNQLQRSGSSPASQQVIVMNPFKHFDRYVSASTQRGGSLSKLNMKKGLVGY